MWCLDILNISLEFKVKIYRFITFFCFHKPEDFLLEWCQSLYEAAKTEDVFPEVSEAVSEAIVRNIGLLKPSSSENGKFMGYSASSI